MPTRTRSGSLLSLVSGLREESKHFLHQEVQLAKTEMSEKAACMGRNAVFVAVGGFIAYAGALLLFIGLSFLLVFAFEKMGLSHEIALFTGPLALGGLIALTGYILIQKGLSAISSTNLAPEKAVETLTGEPISHKTEAREETAASKPGSSEIKKAAQHTRDHLTATVAEIKRRVSPKHIRDTVVAKVKHNPVPSAAIAVGSLAGLWLLRRRNHAVALVCKTK